MERVQGGTYQMGSPASEKDRDDDECQHSVTVSSFYMGKYEVTQAQWKAVMGKNPSDFKGCDDCPVENVSWNDVQNFIKKLNEKTGKTYRLPTEAEWEYAARGGDKSQSYIYAGSNNLSGVAWYDGNSGNKTHSVGKKASNELGLYDMSGNVWEWCSDYYKAYPNCKGSEEDGRFRVVRGGGWGGNAGYCRAAGRRCGEATRRGLILGFRLVSVSLQ
jgi:formylglycine-generating enzyme required for sulfatase activity